MSLKTHRPDYAERRRMLLIELRLIRRTQPAKRVVKHMQRLMKKLRTYRRMMQDAERPR